MDFLTAGGWARRDRAPAGAMAEVNGTDWRVLDWAGGDGRWRTAPTHDLARLEAQRRVHASEQSFRRGVALRKIEVALDRANGRRRTRTVSADAALLAVRGAVRNGRDWAAGDSVANAYKYPAVRTVALAVRQSDGGVALAVGTASASKGSAPKPRWADLRQVRGESDAVAKAARAWADSQTAEQVLPDGGLLLLEPADIEALTEAGE